MIDAMALHEFANKVRLSEGDLFMLASKSYSRLCKQRKCAFVKPSSNGSGVLISATHGWIILRSEPGDLLAEYLYDAEKGSMRLQG